MSEWLFQAFVAPLTQTFFQKALIGGSVVAIVCGVVGCLVVLRRMAFLGDALSHAMIAGIAGGYLFMKVLFGIEAHAPAMLIGSVIAAVLTVFLIGFVSAVSRVKEDAAIGIMYCGVFAGGVTLVSIFRNYIHIDLMHFIMGDVLGVSDTDLWVSVFVSALVLSVIILFFRHFQLTSFDPIMAASIGLPVALIEYALTTCVSLVVVSAVSMVGVILVVGLLITPAATAYLLSDRLSRMMVLAGLFGVTSVVGGLYLSIWMDSAGGGAIMVFCTLQFVTVLFVAPRYGILADWMRRKSMVPQQIIEDILKSILKGTGERLSLRGLGATGLLSGKPLARAIQYLTAEGLIVTEDSSLLLTEKGRREAIRVQRAHRLWESYLDHVGTPSEEIHRRAHVLEHVRDDASVEYLSHVLGHPEQDPHGSAIPQDEDDLTERGWVQLSELRAGQRAVVLSVDPLVAARTPLSPGDEIAMGERRNNGETWVVTGPDQAECTLDHGSCDRILVSIR